MSTDLLTRAVRACEARKKAQITVRVPTHVRAYLQRVAETNGISLNELVARVLVLVAEEQSK